MAGKTDLDTLMAKLADPDVSEKELAAFFRIDEERSRPFAPRFVIDEETVEVPPGPQGEARSALALNAANWWARMRRLGRYTRKIAEGYAGPIIVSEGDSWFQYPFLLEDVVDVVLERYAVYSLGAAGDLLERMADKREYIDALADTGAEILMFSGGGNDLVAGGALADHLEAYDPALKPGDYLRPSFQAILDNAFAQYERIFRQVRGRFPHVTVLCHGYDYPIPKGGRWLGRPMESRGINEAALQKAIAAEMIDLFNRGLRRLSRRMPHVVYIDCRGVVRDRWYDELHPTDAGYADVAALFLRRIAPIANARTGFRVAFDGPFGNAEDLSRAAFGDLAPVASPAVHAPAEDRGRGLSLHLGLNAVDPAHYAGWDGRLAACENDAVAMTELAAREGFETTTLLTRAATREALHAFLEAAAEELVEGDVCLLTVSAHGGHIPDFNGDETDDPADFRRDETLCLYDFQVADDELFLLWSRFRPGVRIVVIPDTCHSQTMIRVNPLTFPGAPAPLAERAAKPRVMPEWAELATVRQNFDRYREEALSYAEIKESVILNPLKTPVKASVLSISACRDDEQALDGTTHGAFTGALLEVWNQGAFEGSYEDFHRAIETRLATLLQTPSMYQAGLPDPAFAKQRPFTIWDRSARPASHAPAAPATAAAPLAPGGVPPSPMIAPGASALAAGEEGAESDVPDPRALEALYAANAGEARLARRAPRDWPHYDAFVRFIDSLGLKHFSADEFLVSGASNERRGSACFGKNTEPPKRLWANMSATALVLDWLRERLGAPIAITSAYRSPAYNACIGGATRSQHKDFRAVDFSVQGLSSREVAWELRRLRDDEGQFNGGIGLYDTFVHLDTRYVNATWPPSFRDASPPARPSTARPARRPSREERIARIEAIELAPTPRGLPRAVHSAFGGERARARARDTEAGAAIALEQQKIKAAVNASSVVSFVENLTPTQKEDVLCSTLFAQRAANKRHDRREALDAWYRVYTETLEILGWALEGAPFEAHRSWDGEISFDRAALGIIASVATGNQLAILTETLDALRDLAEDDDRIRLFDLSTSQAEGGCFQIGAAEAAGDVIGMAVGAFYYVSEDDRKNILFVSWGDSRLDFWAAAQRMSLATSHYADVREVVKERLGATRRRMIADIDI